MEKEQHKATMQVQMVQMEAFLNNTKSTQETNLKMIKFMAMMTQKMGSMEEEEKKPQMKDESKEKMKVQRKVYVTKHITYALHICTTYSICSSITWSTFTNPKYSLIVSCWALKYDCVLLPTKQFA